VQAYCIGRFGAPFYAISQYGRSYDRLILNLTFKLDLERVKMNKHAKYRG